MKALVISEKPSLGRVIEACYKKHRNEIPYTCTFATQRGHLMTLLLPEEIDENMKKWTWDNLPFYPQDHGGWKYKVIQEKKQGNFETSKERYDKIKNYLNSNDFDFIIHAGDPDQEGELLVNLVLTSLNNKLPVKRFWTNDLTEEKILSALKNLKDDQHDPMLTNLLSAAYARQHWDYIFGMNISRGATLQMHGRAACGRVKTVLLNIVVQREKEIANFKPKTVYGVTANYTKGFTGTLFNSSEATTDNEYADADQKAGIVWFDTKKEADDFIKQLENKGKVIKNEKKHSSSYAPKLFKLSTAQVTAGRNGIPDNVTLNTIQGLYEKKILSYPRTDCEYLSSHENFEGILNQLKKIDVLAPFVEQITAQDIARVKRTKKWINDKALEESGHSALSPTTETFDFESLSQTEKTIYLMICKRFVAMFLPPLEQDNVEIVTEVNRGDTKSTFRSIGKRTTSKGFTAIFGINAQDSELPSVQLGEILPITNFEMNEKTSTCPSRFTSSDLIAVCENPAKYLNDESLRKLGKKLKIGTPATRSGIIRQLATPNDCFTENHQRGDGYLNEEKIGKRKVLVPTEAGNELIENLNGLLITKVDMTGIWEERLEMLRKGETSSEEVDKKMRSDFEKMMTEIKNKPMSQISSGKSTSSTLSASCPFCGGKLKKISSIYVCENHKKDDEKSCGFILGSSILGANFTEKDITSLCEKGDTSDKKMKSKKTGKNFSAHLHLNKEERKIELKMADNTTKLACPICGKPIVKFIKGYKCSDDNCSFILWNKMFGRSFKNSELEKLIASKKLPTIDNFVSTKTGKKYSASLYLDNLGKVKLKF